MQILFYDTETTGLRTKTERPYIVQLSYIIYNTETRLVEKVYDKIIRLPESCVMTDEVIKIHHITNEMSQASDTTIEDCLISFVDECKGVDLIVGHNIDFDNKMVLDELKRCEEENEKGDDDPATCLNLVVRNIFIREAMEEFARFNFYCTMRETIEFCNIEASFKTGKKYKKFPKLIELHDKLFGEGTNTLELHNSLNDVYVCFKCYFKLQGIDV